MRQNARIEYQIGESGAEMGTQRTVRDGCKGGAYDHGYGNGRLCTSHHLLGQN